MINCLFGLIAALYGFACDSTGCRLICSPYVVSFSFQGHFCISQTDQSLCPSCNTLLLIRSISNEETFCWHLKTYLFTS